MISNNKKNILFKGANVWHEGHFSPLDVRVADGIVADICSNVEPSPDDTVINAEGKHLLPGLVDLHVHFREPGYSYKETIRTGSEAAARGGFTTVCTMPNLNPAPDCPESLALQLDIINRDACIEVLPYATITRKRLGKECADHGAMSANVAGFSDDGTGVQSEEVMRCAMEGIAHTDKILAAHCEVNGLLRNGYIHDGKWCGSHGHRGICSESEWKEVERDIRLAEETGCRLHICHISTKESVRLIKEGKLRGVRVTCETGPHYLAFCDEDMQEHGRFKMNPPLRSREDMEALRAGVADGTVDVIATDHAPHADEEKSRGLEKSAMGVVGLETSLAAVYTYMVKSGLITLERMVELMSDTPRKILGRKPGINKGEPADLTLVDFNREWIVDPGQFKSLGHSTPFENCNLTGDVLMTFCKGRQVFPN